MNHCEQLRASRTERLEKPVGGCLQDEDVLRRACIWYRMFFVAVNWICGQAKNFEGTHLS